MSIKKSKKKAENARETEREEGRERKAFWAAIRTREAARKRNWHQAYQTFCSSYFMSAGYSKRKKRESGRRKLKPKLKLL